MVFVFVSFVGTKISQSLVIEEGDPDCDTVYHVLPNNVSEKPTASVFRAEGGVCRFLQNVLLTVGPYFKTRPQRRFGETYCLCLKRGRWSP
jgi:hypothetical protein